MARLSKKEIRLLTLFVSALFIAGNGIVLKKYMDGVKLSKAQISTFTQKRQEIDALLSDRLYWEERQVWMEAHQPRLTESGEAQGELIADLQRFARERGIVILDQTILEPVYRPPFQKIAVRLRLTASLHDMVEWLAEIQSPDAFYTVEQMTLSLDERSKEEEQPVICTFQVAKLYRSDQPPPPRHFRRGGRGR